MYVAEISTLLWKIRSYDILAVLQFVELALFWGFHDKIPLMPSSNNSCATKDCPGYIWGVDFSNVMFDQFPLAWFLVATALGMVYAIMASLGA